METNRWDSEGNYHDDNVRIEKQLSGNSGEVVEENLVNVVVKQVSNEIAPVLRKTPNISVEQIKYMARGRFMDLLEKDLLSEREANRCYQRFVQMVSYYYGS